MNNKAYAAALLMLPMVVSAETNFIPHALVRYEDNSNVFASSKPLLDASGDLRLDDKYITYGAGLDINHLWRQNTAYLTSDYRRYNYQNFTQLDRNEYLLSAGTDLTVTRRLTAGAFAKYEQQQVPFSEISTVNFTGDVPPAYTRINHIYGVSAGYLLAPRWKVNTMVSYSKSSLPDYDVIETPWHADVKYLGDGKLTAALVVEGESGKYDGVQDEPKFHQTEVQLKADYKLGARTTVAGAIGRAKRSQPGFEISATTGAASFTQQITAKTNYYVQYTRSVTGYLTTKGAQVDSMTQGGINWQPRPRLGFTANYSYSKSKVDGDFDGTLLIQGRDDVTRAYGASASYDLFKWMKVTPFYRHQKRTSTISDFNFSGNIYGAELVVRFE